MTKKIRRALIAAGLGVAVLVPAGTALAVDPRERQPRPGVHGRPRHGPHQGPGRHRLAPHDGRRHDRRGAEIAQAVVDRLRPQCADKGVALILDAPVPVPIRVDRDRMVQAVTNVIGNALAYTPPAGTVTVTATAQPTGGGRLTVTDSGRGLTAGDTERVFERFYRVGRGRRTGGSGIGLTIARSIVRAHGGDIVATSSGPGRGATFTLTLPSPPDPGRL